MKRVLLALSCLLLVGWVGAQATISYGVRWDFGGFAVAEATLAQPLFGLGPITVTGLATVRGGRSEELDWHAGLVGGLALGYAINDGHYVELSVRYRALYDGLPQLRPEVALIGVVDASQVFPAFFPPPGEPEVEGP